MTSVGNVGRSPDGTTLSPFIDFPNPGTVINVGHNFNSFFANTTTPPAQVTGLAASNFILRHTFQLAVSQGYKGDWSGLFAGLVMAMLPVLAAYIVFQRQVVAGLTAGALK